MLPVSVLLALALGQRIPLPEPAEFLDASVSDAGAVVISVDISPNASLVATDGGLLVAWADSRRREAFDDPALGVDVWFNALLPDGGLAAPFGVMARRAADKVTASHPRLACRTEECVLAWQEDPTFTPDADSLLYWGALEVSGRVVGMSPIVAARARHRSLGLAGTEANIMATWETAGAVRAAFRASAPNGPFTKPSALPGAGLLQPTPSAGSAGYRVTWSELSLQSSVVTTSGFGSGGALLAGLTGTALPTALSPGYRVAVLNGLQPALASLRVVNVLTSTQKEFFQVLPRPLHGATSPAGTGFVAYRGANDTPEVLRLQENGIVETVSLPPDATVHALAGEPRGAVALASRKVAPGLHFLLVPDGVDAGLRELPVVIDPEPDQLVPAVAWSSEFGWAVSRTNARTGAEPGFQVYLPASGQLSDAALGLRSRVIAGRGAQALAAHTIAPGLTTMQALEAGAAGLQAGAVRLSFDGGALSHGALGERVAIAWDTETGRMAWGAGTTLTQGRVSAPMGRCAAWTADARALLLVLATDRPRLVAIPDDVSSSGGLPSADFALSGGEAGAVSGCLAARDGRLFVTFGTRASGITAWSAPVPSGDLASLVLTKVPLGQAVDGQPGRNPVVAASHRGWVVAWEDTRDAGSSIVALEVLDDGGVTAPKLVSHPAREARSPAAASSAAGGVALAWHELDEPRGNTVVQLAFAVSELPDAGVDGGIAGPDGGTAGPDAGSETDGGVDIGPVSFTSCGCGAADGSVLLALALLLARRRATRG